MNIENEVLGYRDLCEAQNGLERYSYIVDLIIRKAKGGDNAVELQREIDREWFKMNDGWIDFI